MKIKIIVLMQFLMYFHSDAQTFKFFASFSGMNLDINASQKTIDVFSIPGFIDQSPSWTSVSQITSNPYPVIFTLSGNNYKIVPSITVQKTFYNSSLVTGTSYAGYTDSTEWAPGVINNIAGIYVKFTPRKPDPLSAVEGVKESSRKK